MGGVTGEVSRAEFGIGGHHQLDGGLGKQLGDGACMAPAKRSCLFGCLAIGRGEAILTAGGASGAATVSDADRFCLALGMTGVFCLRGMWQLKKAPVAGTTFGGNNRPTKMPPPSVIANNNPDRRGLACRLVQ